MRVFVLWRACESMEIHDFKSARGKDRIEKEGTAFSEKMVQN